MVDYLLRKWTSTIDWGAPKVRLKSSTVGTMQFIVVKVLYIALALSIFCSRIIISMENLTLHVTDETRKFPLSMLLAIQYMLQYKFTYMKLK